MKFQIDPKRPGLQIDNEKNNYMRKESLTTRTHRISPGRSWYLENHLNTFVKIFQTISCPDKNLRVVPYNFSTSQGDIVFRPCILEPQHQSIWSCRQHYIQSR